MQFDKIRIAVIAGVVGATLATGAQSLAQHDAHGGGHSMPAMQPGAKQLHDMMMQSAKKTMAMKMPMPSDTDRAFAAMMAEHHMDAIKMAQVEIKYGNDPTVKAMARKILADQTKERTRLLKLAKSAR